MRPIEVLLISKSEELKKDVTHILIEYFRERITLHRADTLQDAIERVEQKLFTPELVLAEQRSQSTAMLRLFFDLVPQSSMIILYSEESFLPDLKPLEVQASLLFTGAVQLELPNLLKKLESSGKFQLPNQTVVEYASIASEKILGMNPLPVDVYLGLPSGKHVKVFRKGDQIEAKDLSKYVGQTFFITKADCELIFKAQVARIEAVSNTEPINMSEAKEVAEISQDLVRSLVANIGFTEQAQRIAKSSVNMSLKLIGSKPRLANILRELKKKDGNFVTSHSFLLGQLACAMAHTIGWNSASTYFKLTMASFLHDISLNIITTEQEATYEEAVRSGIYYPEELKILRFHATKAAEYTRQFPEIPADVEQIVAQHHERADGSGYPRGLSGRYISPLSALFIIAHEMIIFMMKHPDAKPEKFYEIIEKEYSQNPFRKIIIALRTDTKIV